MRSIITAITLASLTAACGQTVGIQFQAVNAAGEAAVAGDVVADDAQTQFGLINAQLHLRDIELDLPDGASCKGATEAAGTTCDEGSAKVIIEGPFIIDLVNNGQGSFAQQATVNVGNSPIGVALADFDAAPGLDAITANSGANNTSVLFNDGAFGTLGSRINVGVGNSPESVAVADLDSDLSSILDFVTANRDSNNVTIRANDGTGQFNLGLNFAVGQQPTSVAVADLNNDTITDIVTANNGNDTISVLLSTR